MPVLTRCWRRDRRGRFGSAGIGRPLIRGRWGMVQRWCGPMVGPSLLAVLIRTAVRAAQWSAGTIEHAGLPGFDETSRPAGRSRHGDIESFGGAAQRQAGIHHAPGQFQPTGRGKDRVRVGHEDLLDIVFLLSTSTTQHPEVLFIALLPAPCHQPAGTLQLAVRAYRGSPGRLRPDSPPGDVTLAYRRAAKFLDPRPDAVLGP